MLHLVFGSEIEFIPSISEMYHEIPLELIIIVCGYTYMLPGFIYWRDGAYKAVGINKLLYDAACKAVSLAT